MKKLLLALAWTLLTYSPVEAVRYWASPAGSNTATCTDIDGSSDPGSYGSFARTVTCAANSGDEAFIKPGTYTSNATITNPASGITIRGTDPTPANWPVLQPVGGTQVRGVHFSASRSNVTFRFIKWDFTNVGTGQGCWTNTSSASATNITIEDFECMGPSVGDAAPTSSGGGPGPGSTGWILQRGKIHRWPFK